MSENTNNTAMMESYQKDFMKSVHTIGRGSMVIAALLSFLPIAYFYFIKGWTAPGYSNVLIAIVAYGFSMWLTEPVSYYPILGSAGTYMGYLAGNVGNMRAPVAMAIQSSLGEEVTSPRGNIATIITIAMSIYVNLCILICIVAAGQFILDLMPQAVLNAFTFTLPSLYGSMLVMRVAGNPKRSFIYLPVVGILYFLTTKVIHGLSSYSLAICIVGTIIWAYIHFKMTDGKNA